LLRKRLEMREDQSSSLQHLDDAELVQRAQSGQRAAFESLFHRHQDRVYTVALAIVGNATDAKDVVQETFVRAYKRLGSLRTDGGVVAYLCKTATNVAIDLVRARKTGKQVSLDAMKSSGIDIPDFSNSPQAHAELQVTNEELMNALLSIPDDQRIVLVLHHLEGVRVDEIADMLGIPMGTVKSRLGRGREWLRRRLYGKVID